MSTANARRLRRDSTEAEKRLWRELRGQQVRGFKFRRQQPIGKFVVDYFCPAAKLIVELDGGQHADNAAKDAERTAWLESRGYRVIRFWNSDVLENMEGVLQTILSHLDAR